jgi:hypothetical protein
MLFDVVSYPGWLIAALGIGLLVGWRTYLDAPRRWRDGWIIWGALAFVIGVIVAALKLLPGRHGLWLEIALLMFAFYIVGCFLGGGLKRLLGAHASGGAAAMPPAADIRNGAKLEAERQATAKAAADRLAVEVAAKAEAERKAAAAKAEADRLAAEAAAKAEADRRAAAANAEAERVAAEAAAKAEAERRATAARAEADRLAAEAAAQAEAERARAEIERRAAAAAQAEAERLATAALAKAEADRLTAAAVAKALADRKAAAVKAAADKAEADRLALAAVAKSETDGSAATTEPDDPARTRGRRPSERRLPPPTHRRIVLWRKPPQRPRLHEKQSRLSKPRRVIWLQRVPQRSRIGETPPSRPMRPVRRRTVWLRRLPRPRSIGKLTLRYLRRTQQT